MTTLRDLIGYYRPYWSPAVFTLIASSLFEIVDLLVPYAIGQILNLVSQDSLDQGILVLTQVISQFTGIPEGSGLSLSVLMGLIFVATVLKAPVQPWLTHWMHWDISFRARRDHYIEAHTKLLTLPLDYFDENNSGRISALVARGISNHMWSFPQMVGQLIPKVARVAAIFLLILVTEWRIGLVFVVSFVTILGISLVQLRRISHWEKRLEDYAEETQSRTSEIITNIKTVKAFAAEPQELEQQRRRLEREFKVLNYRIHHSYVKLNVLRTTVVQACTFTILLITLLATLKDYISLGQFVMVQTIATMAFSEVTPIGTFAEYFVRRYAAMARLHEFLNSPPGSDAADLQTRRRDPQILIRPRSAPSETRLECQDLTFGYQLDQLVLKNFNLIIHPRQTVAIVGRSGSGKSTFVKLLFRYFEPTSGRILLNGQPIQTFDIIDYRRRLAIVHQDVDMFNGTIFSNLIYGAPGATLAQVQEACRIARVDDFVEALPKGYQTVVGERGIRLSGGQRQRLGIARALVTDPDVLVFDEATSSLDYESERAIQLAMRGILGTRITIIIAHRLSTVREADQIVVLDQGRIIELGTHSELLRQSGLYSRLHALQETGELLA